MKNNRSKIILAVILAVVTLLSAAAPAFAAAKVKVVGKTLFMGDCSETVEIKNLPKKAKLLSIQSSNEDVLTAYEEYGYPYSNELTHFLVSAESPGKSKVTIKYKVGGKTYTASAVYKVKAYPNPIKYIRINGKNIKLYNPDNTEGYIGFQSHVDHYDKKSVTIDVKPSKGWKIIKKQGTLWGKKSKNVNIKFNKSFSFSKNENLDLYMTLRNGKGETLSYQLSITRSAYCSD